MPVRLDAVVRRVDQEEFGRLDYSVMKHAFGVHNALGRLADEAVYRKDFSNRLRRSGGNAREELCVTVSFGGFSKRYSLDVLVGDWGIYELKVVRTLTDDHVNQVLNYLRLLDLSHAKLINFRGIAVETRFVNSSLSKAERIDFRLDTSRSLIGDEMVRLLDPWLRDWGTGLSRGLYAEALDFFVREAHPDQSDVVLYRNGQFLGSLATPQIRPGHAAHVTTFKDVPSDYATQLRRLHSHTNLRYLEWINISDTRVATRSIPLD